MGNDFLSRMARIGAQRRVILGLVVRNLKEKYAGSVLGILWSVINPVLIMLAVAFVFTRVLSTGIERFPLFVLSALLPWFFFSNSVSESAVSLPRSTELLNRFVISREVIPVSVVLANFLNFLFGFLLILPVFAVFNPAVLPCLFFLPLVMLLHLVFTAGLGMLLSVAGVFLKDLSQVLNVALMLLFWITPIFYPSGAVPAGYRFLVTANPASGYVLIYRSLLYDAKVPGSGLWVPAVIFALFFFLAGYLVFISRESEIPKLL